MKATQREKIIDYIKKHGSISPLEALSDFGCMQLPTRIFELKKQGYNIKTTMVKAKNKKGEPIRYARYSLEEKQC